MQARSWFCEEKVRRTREPFCLEPGKPSRSGSLSGDAGSDTQGERGDQTTAKPLKISTGNEWSDIANEIAHFFPFCALIFSGFAT